MFSSLHFRKMDFISHLNFLPRKRAALATKVAAEV
jgi:hypothetical protein